MDELDATLDSMTPDELRILEVEIDKKASANAEAYYFDLGVKVARDSFEQFQATGELSPALFLVKSAAENVQKQAEVEATLDKCSAEELATLEAELDARILDKVSSELAASYFEQGAKLARVVHAEMNKEAAGGLLGSAVSGVGGMFAKGGLARKGLAHGMRFARNNPMAAGAAMGVGGTLVAQKVLDR